MPCNHICRLGSHLGKPPAPVPSWLDFLSSNFSVAQFYVTNIKPHHVVVSGPLSRFGSRIDDVLVTWADGLVVLVPCRERYQQTRATLACRVEHLHIKFEFKMNIVRV